MVNSREKLFLVAGSAYSQRRLAVNQIKNKILAKEKFSGLNSVILYSKEIKPDDIKRQLLNFSFEKHRLVIFKNSFLLSAAVKKYILQNLDKIISHNYLIFEMERGFSQLQRDKKFSSDSLFTLLAKQATQYRIKSEDSDDSMNDFRQSIRRNNLASSLYAVEKLFNARPKDRGLGPQILGILTYQLSYSKNPFQKKEGLLNIWEADRALKEKGLDARLVIETLLVKLLKG